MSVSDALTLGYLSGAMRVSTRDAAESSGPRSHVLGVIHAFEELGWQVPRFIVGDRVPVEWVSAGSRERVSGSPIRRVAADTMRLASAAINARRAWKELGTSVDWVYERFGAFQSLGRRFHDAGRPWILETNSPLYREAVGARKSVALDGIVRRMEMAAYRDCDVLVCISNALAEILVDECRIERSKVVVMANGVDTRFFDPGRVTPVRRSDRFTIGFVGNMYAWAGLHLLLRTVATVRSSGEDIGVVLVGDGAERPRLEALARELGIDAVVDFVGRVPWGEVPAHVAGFDLCYSGQIPVHTIGVMYHSPLKLYEYMAMGRAILASSFEDATRALEHGRTGFLFEPGNEEQLRARILQAVARRDTVSEMGEAARRAAIAKHSWRARVLDLIASVDAILGRGKSSVR